MRKVFCVEYTFPCMGSLFPAVHTSLFIAPRVKFALHKLEREGIGSAVCSNLSTEPVTTDQPAGTNSDGLTCKNQFSRTNPLEPVITDQIAGTSSHGPARKNQFSRTS